jgi:hypothetical protein
MERPVICQAFDGGYLTSIGVRGKHQAGIHRISIHQNSAGSAIARAASFFCACEVEGPSKKFHERCLWVHLPLMALAVHGEIDSYFHVFFSSSEMEGRQWAMKPRKQARACAPKWTSARMPVLLPKRMNPDPAPSQQLHQRLALLACEMD